ncbi:MAG: hydrogenase small subunit [Geovibrio sp.]|nr:hydrogenase small subunit [Geovibrio sp.]
MYCCIAGDTALNQLKKAAAGAAMVIAVGNCASFGGIPAAYPNPTGAKGVADLVKGVPVVNLPGCPMNCDNLTALIVHYLIFGTLPALDNQLRPKFAHGKRIHDNCERRGHFDAGQYVEKWGDEGHRQGWCLYKMGCKGPQTWHNCPTLRWNDGLSWPVMAGHGCVGCSEPGFIDTMSPFYRRLPEVPGFGVESSATSIGLKLVGVATAFFAVHGVVSIIRNRGTVKKVEEEYYEKEEK